MKCQSRKRVLNVCQLPALREFLMECTGKHPQESCAIFFFCRYGLIFQNLYIEFVASSLMYRICFLHISFCLFSTLYSYSTSKYFYLWSSIQSGSWLPLNRNPSDNFLFAKSLFNLPLGDVEYLFSGRHTKSNWCDLGQKAKNSAVQISFHLTAKQKAFACYIYANTIAWKASITP